MTATAAPAKPNRPLNLAPRRKAAIAAGILVAAATAYAIAGGLHLELLFAQPLVIQIHVYAALATFALGGVILLARKGRTFHIRAGWTWVLLMGTTAFASLFITGINGDWWSWIHILSGATLLNLPLAVRFARKRNLVAHSQMMTWLYVGGMIIAGGFTFIPGRLMWRIVFG